MEIMDKLPEIQKQAEETEQKIEYIKQLCWVNYRLLLAICEKWDIHLDLTKEVEAKK
jgi:hypothetical protein